MTLSYDALGNRLTKDDSSGTTGYQFDLANELTLTTPPSGAPTTSSYDPNGNLALEVTGSSRTTMTWDGENRLTRLELPDGTTEENVYRADGLRHKHVDSGGTIHPIWDDRNVLLEKNADIATQAIYTQLPGIWGGAYSFKRGATHYFLLPDLQGHTRQTVNASETLLASCFDDAWGREVWPVVGGGLCLRPFGQWGYWRDTASRLYVRARHLLPELGRWMSRDPVLAVAPRESAYAYAQSRPAVAADPSRLIVEPAGIGEPAEIISNTKRHGYACRCGWIDAPHLFDADGKVNKLRHILASRAEFESGHLEFEAWTNVDERGIIVARRCYRISHAGRPTGRDAARLAGYMAYDVLWRRSASKRAGSHSRTVRASRMRTLRATGLAW